MRPFFWSYIMSAALSPLTTAVLIGLKKILPPQYSPALKQRFVKSNVTFPTRAIVFDKIKKGRKLAPFVSPMVGGKAKRHRGATMTTVSPGYIKETDNVTSDHIMKRRPGEMLMGELTPAQRRNLIRADLLVEQEEAIERTEEWMLAEVMKTGRVVVTGEGFEPIEIDYGRREENNVTLSTKWSTLDKATSEQPLEDLEEWASRCTIVADQVLMGPDAWKEFKSFACVKELMDTRRGSSSNGEIGPTNNTSFQWVAKVGTFDISVYKGVYEGSDGEDKHYIDRNGVLVTGEPEIYMAYGAIEDVKANANGLVEATRYPSNWFTDNPSVEWLQTQTAPVPVLLDANEICYALV